MARQRNLNYTIDRFSGARITKPGLKLIGAKTKIRDLLYGYFIQADAYVEPFLGTGGVLIGNKKARKEVVGDLNEYLINYYKVVQNRSEEFWEVFKSTYDGFSAERFYQLKKEVTDPCINDVQRAVDFYLITKHCMNGIWRLNKKGNCNSSWGKELTGRGIFDRLWFDEIVMRVQGVIFQNVGYETTLFQAQLMAQEGIDTFAFLDPPYHDCLTTYNGKSFDDADFCHLYTLLRDAKYRWLMTINDDEYIRSLFEEFEIVPHEVFYSCSQTSEGRGKKKELLVSNYPLDGITLYLQSLIDAKEKPTQRVKETVDRLDKAPGKRANARSNKVSSS